MQVLLDYPKDMTALMLLGSLPLYEFLTNIKVFCIDPLAAKEPSRATTDASELDEYGRNVASVLSRLEAEPEFREQVQEWLELIVPGMESISTETQRLDSSTVITFRRPAQNPLPGAGVGWHAVCVVYVDGGAQSRRAPWHHPHRRT